jgi:predicted HAD superfamily Cof-like phosphohydrolase
MTQKPDKFIPQYWHRDIAAMHRLYRFNIKNFSDEELADFWKFRLEFLREELTELETATTADDAVDALIDLCVIAIGTLDLYGVDSQLAWNRVLDANLSKEVGVKETRPQTGTLPDLIKPEGWIAPYHHDNVGLIDRVIKS